MAEKLKLLKKEIGKQKENSKNYLIGIDIIKTLAVFFVIGIHSFLYNGFYLATINNTKYIIPIALRWIFFTCVPLFMITTGYLMKNKKLSKNYYKGLIKIIVIYIFISILCMLSDTKYLNTKFTPWLVMKGYLEYSNATYGWYINYYISLFCIIPFLNLAFNNLENKKQKLTLVITVTLLTIFARSFFIGFKFETQSKLLPDYFNAMWPIAYYYIGTFIREYPPKKNMKKKLLILLILIAAITFLTVSTYHQSYNNVANNQILESWHFNDYGSYPVCIIAVCIFLMLFDIDIKNNIIKFIFRQISNVTLGLYLISYIFDRAFYTSFVSKYPITEGSWNFERFIHTPNALFNIFFKSLFWALVIHKTYECLECLIKLWLKKRKTNHLNTD